MKRFHVHVSVEDLSAAVRFYSTLFGTAPRQSCCYARSDRYWITDAAGEAAGSTCCPK